jgi:hypothetical protein
MSKARELAELGAVYDSGALSNRNVVINGAMQVAQRETSSTGVGGSDGYFTCDRWNFAQGTNAGRLTMTQDSSAPAGFANSLKLACTTADTSIGADEAALIQHKIEGQNLQRFAKGTSGAKQFTLSFYVKGNASATYTAELFDSDNTRANGKTFSVTTDWTRVEITLPADTTGAFDDDNAASLDLNIWLHAGSTYTGGTFTNGTWTTGSNPNVRVGSGTSFYDSTSRTFFITGVQLEVGDTATPFEHRSYGDELLRCQRYFYALIRRNMNEDQQIGSYYNLTRAFINVPHKVSMRAAPTISVVGSVAVDIYSKEAYVASTTLANTYPRIESTGLDFTPSSNGPGGGNAFHLDWTHTSTSNYIKAEAEL